MGCEGHLQEAAITGQHNLPTLNCECGFQIMLVPDITAMTKAIQKHAKKCLLQKHYNKLGLGKTSETKLTLELLQIISSDSFQEQHLEWFK